MDMYNAICSAKNYKEKKVWQHQKGKLMERCMKSCCHTLWAFEGGTN